MHILFFVISLFLATTLAADPRLSQPFQVRLSPLQVAQYRIAQKWYQALPKSIQSRQLIGPPGCDVVKCTLAGVGFSRNCATALVTEGSNVLADIQCVYSVANIFTLLYQGTCSSCASAITTELSNDLEEAINHFYPSRNPPVRLLQTLLTI